MKCILLMLAFVALTSGAVKPNGNIAVDELEKVQGTWKFVSLEVDGAKIPEEMLKGCSIIIQGDSFTTFCGEVIGVGVIYERTIKIDVSTKPKRLDLIFTAGPEKAISLGIYELDGENLRICLGLANRNRPTEFVSRKGSGHALETLKRGEQ